MDSEIKNPGLKYPGNEGMLMCLEFSEYGGKWHKIRKIGK